MTVWKLILRNNLVGSLWTSTLSFAAYGRWFNRLSLLLTGEYTPDTAFLTGKSYGWGPYFGLQLKFCVYKQCKGPLFWHKTADRPSSKSHRDGNMLARWFQVSQWWWMALFVDSPSLHKSQQITSFNLFPQECFYPKPPAWCQRGTVYLVRQTNKHVTKANKKRLFPKVMILHSWDERFLFQVYETENWMFLRSLKKTYCWRWLGDEKGMQHIKTNIKPCFYTEKSSPLSLLDKIIPFMWTDGSLSKDFTTYLRLWNYKKTWRQKLLSLVLCRCGLSNQCPVTLLK